MDSSSSVASSSSLPSTSVLPLPQPGKSILKRAPPPQSRFFSISTLSKLLPTPAPGSTSSTPLKRAHFILPQIQTVYTISTSNPPSTATLKDEKKSVELREAERRRTVVRGNSFLQDKDAWWTMERVESFYRECCQGREEDMLPQLCVALRNAAPSNQTRTVDLSGIRLTPHTASAFADVLTVEWGLRKLVMRDCDLEEASLKSILHALLITNTLSFLSLASNRRLKISAWRVLGAYIGKARSLQFLDLSSNILDKKAIEYLVASFEAAPANGNAASRPSSPTTASVVETSPPLETQSVVSLRLDDCSLRPGALDVLAHAARPSSLRNLSLRLNRITATGAVAIALIIKDYPDAISPSASPHVPLTPPGTPSRPGFPPDLKSPVESASPLNGTATPPMPPPRHPSTQAHQTTTYTPYIPKSKRVARPPPPDVKVSASVPLITSSAQGGITVRHSSTTGPSAALLDNIRALDSLPRLGALRTLDLRGNELRAGVSYIAQVLKRNRTLKVLNLSDNKIDMTGLLSIAEALKYNSSLETLDLSRNPCCGPGLDGVTSLRTAFTLNTSLKRLFLSATSLTSAGAIALAEFLPESLSLYHLDLTANPGLDMAGIVALNAGLKKNSVMRCLDLDIPPGDEQLARLCREILNSCIRNTEYAEEVLKNSGASPDGSVTRGIGKGVWGMIEDSVLAKSFREKDSKESSDTAVQTARKCLAEVEALFSPMLVDGRDPADREQILRDAKQAQLQLSGMIPTIASRPRQLEELLTLNDSLTEKLLLAASHHDNLPVKAGQNENLTKLRLTSRNGSAYEETEEQILSPRLDKGKGRAEPEFVEKILSPSFTVGDSDDEGDISEPLGPRLLTIGGMVPLDADVADGDRPVMPSPIERSRLWVEEEGEIFRKGQALLGPEDLEGEFAGEELRIELLEAEVERPPQRQLGNEDEDVVQDLESLHPSSPLSPSTLSAELPRPSLSRSRSSSLDNVHPA